MALFRLLQEENLNTRVAFSLAGPEGERPTVLPGPLSVVTQGLRNIKAPRAAARR